LRRDQVHALRFNVSPATVVNIRNAIEHIEAEAA
jgi:hypothetical protein